MREVSDKMMLWWFTTRSGSPIKVTPCQWQNHNFLIFTHIRTHANPCIDSYHDIFNLSGYPQPTAAHRTPEIIIKYPHNADFQTLTDPKYLVVMGTVFIPIVKFYLKYFCPQWNSWQFFQPWLAKKIAWTQRSNCLKTWFMSHIFMCSFFPVPS